MKTLFIVNPRSGIRRRDDVTKIIRSGCSEWAAEVEITTCSSIGDLDDIIGRAQRDGMEAVFAVGGDGTVHEVSKRLIGTGMALGILARGSGNGLARHLGIPMNPHRALSVCRDGVIATIDTAIVNDEPWVGVMGTGLDAVVAERFAGSAARGMRTYIGIGLRTFAAYRPEEYEIVIAGKARRVTAYAVAVANSSQYGNNARIAPLASLQDGLLEVVIIRHMPLYAAPLLLMRLFNGTFHQSRHVEILQAPEVTIRRRQEGAVHVDGEPMTLPAMLDVRIRPQSLRVLLSGGLAKI